MDSISVSEIDPSADSPEFNKYTHHPLQSWEWGEARKQMGVKVIRFGEYRLGDLINAFQLTVHPIAAGWSIGYLPRSVFPSPEVLEFLRNVGKRERLLFIKIEPYVKKESVTNELPTDLRVSPHPLFPNWTQILDLTIPEEELLRRMKQKTRYNIRLAEKKGVTVSEKTDEDGYRIFERLYFDTCRRQKYYGHSKRYHRIIFDALKQNTARILIAFYGDVALASYELFLYDGVFYYPYGGSSALHRNYMPANLLMWEAIRLGKKLGAKKFDMWGSLPPDYSQNDSWAGFTRFKEGYGAEFVRMMDGLDLIINPQLYFLYNAAYKLRNIALSVARLF